MQPLTYAIHYTDKAPTLDRTSSNLGGAQGWL